MKEVPLKIREYKLPRRPITVAPMKETISERSKIWIGGSADQRSAL